MKQGTSCHMLSFVNHFELSAGVIFRASLARKTKLSSQSNLPSALSFICIIFRNGYDEGEFDRPDSLVFQATASHVLIFSSVPYLFSILSNEKHGYVFFFVYVASDFSMQLPVIKAERTTQKLVQPMTFKQQLLLFL